MTNPPLPVNPSAQAVDTQAASGTHPDLDSFTRLPAEATFPRRTAARKLLQRPDIHTLLLQSATTPTGRQAAFDIAHTDIEDHLDQAWTRNVEAWIELLHASWQESAHLCSNTAWAGRQAGSSVLGHLTLDRVLRTPASSTTARTRLHLYALALRYDFRCRSIQELFDQHTTPVRELDPFSRALHTYALLGQSNPAALDLIAPLLADADDHPKVAHALLHGLWMGEDLPNQPREMLTLLERPVFAARPDGIALFRKARALRRLRRLDEALTAINDAMEHLAPGTDASVHSDLVRERSLIIAARESASLPTAATCAQL
ncbi:hypothetical protein [Streptomyces niveus]|uniref:hypothetical protein n=1 Tax=Streptomyces niveus TaxID=193462 RepID=UPI0034374568